MAPLLEGLLLLAKEQMARHTEATRGGTRRARLCGTVTVRGRMVFTRAEEKTGREEASEAGVT